MSTNVGAHTGFYPQNASYKPSTPEDIATHVHILYIYGIANISRCAKWFFIMIVLIGDAESVCDMKECSDSYSTVVTD